METEHYHYESSIKDESSIEKNENLNEDKIDIKYYVDNFNGATKFTYKKIDKSDPNNEKCFEFVDFFDICPDDFVKSGIINFVINEIENTEQTDNKMKKDTNINTVFQKLHIATMEKEKIHEISKNEDILKRNNSGYNYNDSLKKLSNIPKITITNHENEVKNININNDNKTNQIYTNDKTIEYASIIADKIYNDAININNNILANDTNVNILHKYSDLKEFPLSSLNNSENNNEEFLNNIKKDPSRLINYDYQAVVNDDILIKNENSDKVTDSIKDIEEKKIDSNLFLSKQKMNYSNYNSNNNFEDFKQLKYNFDEHYAKTLINHHESFKKSKNSLSDEEKIKTVITLKNNGFSDILNVNHCIDCILERTLQANPFYHAQPDRLSMRCSKCKPCNRHTQTNTYIDYMIKENTLDEKNHECICEDICKEVNCSICSIKIPLCKNLEHEKNCTDKYSAPIQMPQISNSEKSIKFLRSDSNEMVKNNNENFINTTFEKEKNKDYVKSKKSWFKKIMTCNSCKSGKRKIYNQN
ncbi:Hypothetical protein SRAE_2000515400 [Strongyloides ratti]|uniref:Uncharacterized protein n=1 Tax=Strongyloides ratti TaxID=34506 RepID=A0A090LSD8_STRRB|nr:Hypothetical protein SRAE_2000515400 [Strongyloides ratti]CEF70523.1 Hypothetical protein SRAE_2000515400 [Strongyloides ratti]